MNGTAKTAFGLPAVVPNSNIKIELENADLWAQFNEHTTEMIVTKTGRLVIRLGFLIIKAFKVLEYPFAEDSRKS